MTAYLRGYVVCDACGKTASATATFGTRGGPDMYWSLPEGWLAYTRNQWQARVYCGYGCNKHSAVMGSPDVTGKRKHADVKYDPRTMDKLIELIETSSGSGIEADAVLSALEAVLMAWRQRGVPTL